MNKQEARTYLEYNKEIVEDIISNMSAVIEQHVDDTQTLMLVTSAMFSVVQKCYVIILGEEGAALFFKETSEAMMKKKQKLN
jgi:uncharacterized protein YejL (UPF0352 family)